MSVDKFSKLIPVDKSWLTRIGVLDILNGYVDIEEFIDGLENPNEDIMAIRNASSDWRKKRAKIRVGESATLYRLLRFACWKENLNKVFVKEGSLISREITNDANIVRLSQEALLALDNGTTQWATAKVICGDKERLSSPPLKLNQTYDAVDHWNSQRKKGLCWEPKPDATIKRQADTFLILLKGEPSDYKPLCSDDYCFARIFDFINKENGAKFWPSLIGHETNRLEEMERAIKEAQEVGRVSSKDHRVVEALAMWGAVHRRRIAFLNPSAVNKSWPQFWNFLNLAERGLGDKEVPRKRNVDEIISGEKIISLISEEARKEKNTISLIPSENVMSSLASGVYTLRSNNRYVIKSKIGSRYFIPGRENLGNLIATLEQKLCAIYGSEFCITKGLSGIHNMDINVCLKKDFR